MKKMRLSNPVFSLFILAMLAFGLSCKKSKGDGGGSDFMKFKMDGAEITWTEGFAEHLDDGSYSANGFSSTASNAKIVTISLYNDGPVELNTEYAYPAKNVRIKYIDENNVHYANVSAVIKLTKETDSYISGTFSGQAKNDFNDTKTITDGSFSLSKVR